MPVRVPVRQLGYGPISRIAALPDGEHIVSIGGQGAYVWDLTSGEVVRSLRHPIWMQPRSPPTDPCSLLPGRTRRLACGT